MNAKTVSNRNLPQDIIVFGEVLVDEFPDGRQVIGGAPMNVAWNLQAIGMFPHFVSAVGADEIGKRIIDSSETWGMSTDQIQVDVNRPTGRAVVTIGAEGPEYDLPLEQAYDYIRFPQGLVDSLNVNACPLLYHGSLCCRSAVTFETLIQLRRTFEANIVVDINLRDGHYEPDVIADILNGASVLKCSRDELAELSSQSCESAEMSVSSAQQLMNGSSLREVWVTDGDKGAMWCAEDGRVAKSDAEQIDSSAIEDTVGAGDAFMAVVLAGIARDEPREAILKQAVKLSAKVCTLQGATTSDGTFYEFAYKRPVSEIANESSRKTH